MSNNQEYSPWRLVHGALLMLVIVAALFGNSFVCIAVCRVRRLQKVSNYFLVSLAVADIIIVLFHIPFRIYFNITDNWLLGEHLCRFWIFIDIMCSTASIVNLLLISVDRYLALSLSLRYRAIATVARCLMAIAAVWLYAFTIAVLSLPTWSRDGLLIYQEECRKSDKIYYLFSTLLAILLPLILLIFMYCLVFKIAFAQRQKIAQNRSTSVIYAQNNGGVLQTRGHTKRLSFAIKELKAAKTIIIVVGVFLICWLPMAVLVVLFQFAPSSAQKFSPVALLFLLNLPHSNSCLNPYIYTFFNAEFRDVFKRSMRKVLPFLKQSSNTVAERQSKTVSENEMTSDGIVLDGLNDV